MIKKLIKLADFLDSAKLTKEASAVDRLIKLSGDPDDYKVLEFFPEDSDEDSYEDGYDPQDKISLDESYDDITELDLESPKRNSPATVHVEPAQMLVPRELPVEEIIPRLNVKTKYDKKMPDYRRFFPNHPNPERITLGNLNDPEFMEEYYVENPFDYRRR